MSDRQTMAGHLTQLRTTSRSIIANPRVKIDVSKTQYPVVKQAAQLFQWRRWSRQDSKNESNLFWVDSYVSEEQVRQLKPYQKINHFPRSNELGRKDSLARNLLKFRKRFPSEFAFFPDTWLLPQHRDRFLRQLEKGQGCFIAKPQASCQGRGIYLFDANSLPNEKSELVVQRYISDVLLVDGLKFDFRVYVLVKSIYPLSIYLYKEGLARLATNQYQPPTIQNLTDKMMHLTNYAINKLNPSFKFNQSQQKDDEGHKRSYSAVMEVSDTVMQQLAKMGVNTARLQQQIDDIIVKTVISAHALISESYRGCRELDKEQISVTESQKLDKESVCFEILGFDIMIDKDCQPLLIEVNHTPSFVTDTPLDNIIKKHLLVDTMNLLNITDTDRKRFLLKRFYKREAETRDSDDSKLFTTRKARKLSDEPQQTDKIGAYRRIYPTRNTDKMKLYDQLIRVGYGLHKISFKIHPPIQTGRLPEQLSPGKSPERAKVQPTHRRSVSNNDPSNKGPFEILPLYMPVCRINPQLATEFDFPLAVKDTPGSDYVKRHKQNQRVVRRKWDVESSNGLNSSTAEGRWVELQLTTSTDKPILKEEPSSKSHKESMERIEKSCLRDKIKLESNGLVLNVTQTFYKRSPLRTSRPGERTSHGTVRPFRMIVAEGRFEINEPGQRSEQRRCP